jgi:hypothetical protein
MNRRSFLLYLAAGSCITFCAGEQLPHVVPGKRAPYVTPDVGEALISKGRLELSYSRARFLPFDLPPPPGHEGRQELVLAEGELNQMTYEVASLKAIDPTGKSISIKVLSRLLRRSRPVLYVIGNQNLDPNLLQLLKEGTPILILPYCPDFPPDSRKTSIGREEEKAKTPM